MQKQKTLFIFLTNKQIICYKHLLLIKLSPQMTEKHSLVHKSRRKRKNYIDRLVTNSLSVFSFKGNQKTNLKIFLSLRFLSGFYERKKEIESDSAVSIDTSSTEVPLIRKEKDDYTLRDWSNNIFNINKEECKGMIFEKYKATGKQQIIISLLNKERKKWISLFKKDISSCLSFASFLRLDFFNYFNVSSSFLFLEERLHEEFCKKEKVVDFISEIETNYKIIKRNFERKKEIPKELFFVFVGLDFYEDIFRIKAEIGL